MTDYARLTEHNEWEGETWHFYIPREGNVDALVTLENLIDEEDPDGETFELADRDFTEDEVTLLVNYGDTSQNGYLAGHNKLDGKLKPVTDMDRLYKSGIRDLMIEGD